MVIYHYMIKTFKEEANEGEGDIVEH